MQLQHPATDLLHDLFHSLDLAAVNVAALQEACLLCIWLFHIATYLRKFKIMFRIPTLIRTSYTLPNRENTHPQIAHPTSQVRPAS